MPHQNNDGNCPTMDLIEVKEGKYFRHPWEIARAASILCIIPKVKFANIADIGAGDLYFLKLYLKQFAGKAFAVDRKFKEIHDFGEIALLGNIEEIPDNSIDIAFLMDVLEHEKNDICLLMEAVMKVKSGGFIVVPVPAYQYLFSEHDIYLKHYRRYNRARLVALTNGLDVEIIECFFFFTLLFFIRLIHVIFSKLHLFTLSKIGVGEWTFAQSHFLTIILSNLLKCDFAVNRLMSRIGLFSFGLSICMILKKKSV
jgi:hypothetical protein